jgi:hypothetical protein
MGLKIEQLQEDELEWELRYRKIGFRADDTLTDKQSLLKASLRTTAKGAPDTRGELWEDLVQEEERKTIETKYKEIEEKLKEKGQKARDFGSFESRLLHIERRIVALCRAEKDPTRKQELSQLLLNIRSLYGNFFGKDVTAAKGHGGLTSQIDVFDLFSDQTQSENDTSKGAIKKKTVKPTEASKKTRSTEPAVLTRSQIEAKEKENQKEKEQRLEQMLAETEKRLQNIEESESDSSEDEIEALLKLQESTRIKLEIAKLKNKGKKYPKLTESSFEKPKLKSRNSVHSSTETSDSEKRGTPLSTRIKAKTKRREKSSEDERGLRVEKWNFRYSSTGGLSLVEFLRRVDRYRETQNVSDENLVRKAFFLFEGVALDWYDENRHRFRKWKDVVAGLRSAFVAEDNDFLVRQKCEGRKQQNAETFEVYLAQMSKLFQGLSYKMPDQEKFEILKRNVKSSHRLGIALLQVENLDDLKNACRCLDGMDSSLYSLATDSPNSRQNTQSRAQILELDHSGLEEEDRKEAKKMVPNKKKKSVQVVQKQATEKTVASVFRRPERSANDSRSSQFSGGPNRKFYPNQNNKFESYNGHQQSKNDSFSSFSESLGAFMRAWSDGRGQDNRKQSHNTRSQSQSLNASAKTFQPKGSSTQTRVEPVNDQGQTVCWNCDGLNHHQKFCRAPRRVVCWGCGRKDTYRDKCPTCSGNEQQRLN